MFHFACQHCLLSVFHHPCCRKYNSVVTVLFLQGNQVLNHFESIMVPVDSLHCSTCSYHQQTTHLRSNDIRRCSTKKGMNPVMAAAIGHHQAWHATMRQAYHQSLPSERNNSAIDCLSLVPVVPQHRPVVSWLHDLLLESCREVMHL